ncbi:MAG: phosphate ABC transporter permease subunit PstC [Erysipelotrichaceae bacterium]
MNNNLKEKITKYIFVVFTSLSIFAVLFICYFLFSKGIPTILNVGVKEFLLGNVWQPSSNLYGIMPMILGSIYTTLIAIIIGVPVGVLSAIFLARFCPKGIYKYLKPCVNLLAGIPSVVYGFFGLMVVVPFIRDSFGGRGSSLLAAGLVLSMMILPTIINICESSLRAVDDSYYEASLALGASNERSIFRIVLPAAKSGIFAGIILGIGRAIGETMAVVMVAGNQAIIPNHLLNGVRTLTTNIVLEMGYAQDLHRDALIATGVILFIFILIINLVFNYVKGRSVNE